VARYTFPVRLFHPLLSARFTGAFQDSLPAAGQLCRAGLITRWVPTRGFRALYISSPSPRLPLAHNGGFRTDVPNTRATNTPARPWVPRRMLSFAAPCLQHYRIGQRLTQDELARRAGSLARRSSDWRRQAAPATWIPSGSWPPRSARRMTTSSAVQFSHFATLVVAARPPNSAGRCWPAASVGSHSGSAGVFLQQRPAACSFHRQAGRYPPDR
jgi:hypothetical protein